MKPSTYHHYKAITEEEETIMDNIDQLHFELLRADRALRKNRLNYNNTTLLVESFAKENPDQGIPLDLILEQGAAYMAMLTFTYEVERLEKEIAELERA